VTEILLNRSSWFWWWHDCKFYIVGT